MHHYAFAPDFLAVYERAVAAFGQGKRGPDQVVSAADTAWLAANGIAAQHLYDYAEDHHGYGGEPGPAQALAIESIRRDYFFNAQGGVASTARLDDSALPAKTDTVRGVAWLPRLLPKARAKLRGELPPSLMYGCGGDRRFFKEHNIAPAEFLNLVWRHEGNPDAVVDWVVRRTAQR